MPEVERAVAAGRVAHVGREHLPRRRAQLPAAPSRRDVREENNRSDDEIEFAEHDTKPQGPGVRGRGAGVVVCYRPPAPDTRPPFLFSTTLRRRGFDFFKDASLVNPSGRRRLLKARLVLLSEAGVALQTG